VELCGFLYPKTGVQTFSKNLRATSKSWAARRYGALDLYTPALKTIYDNFAPFLKFSALVYKLPNNKMDEFSYDVFHVPFHGKVQSQSLPEKQTEPSLPF